MSQIVYTELEAFPIRWPYLQLEPLDTMTTRTWTTEQTFNTPFQNYGPGDTGSPESVNVFGNISIGQIIRRHVNYELVEDLRLTCGRVGNPGPLKVELYTTKRAENIFLTHWLREWLQSAAGEDPVSPTTWRAVTRSFPRKVRIAAIAIIAGGVRADRYQIRTANTNGSPSSTIIASGAFDSSGVATFSPPLEFDAGLYSFIVHMSSGTGNIYHSVSRAPASDFGSDHSTWVSTDAGVTWSSANRTNYAVSLWIHPLAYIQDRKLAEYEIPQANIGTSVTSHSVLPADGRKIIYLPNEMLMVVFSAPQGNSSNYYVIHRGTTYVGQNPAGITEEHIAEISSYFDGSSWTYRPHDLLIQKTYLPPISYQHTNTYFVSPGSYSPKITVNIRAVSGTVGFRPAVFVDVFGFVGARKTTTSTTFVNLTWDVSETVPEIKAPMGRIYFYADGNGAYNQIAVEPRIYYDKNPVTPRDFGFMELYLMRVRAEANNTLVRVNDRTNLFFATAGDSVVIDPNFRSYISKLQVVTGRATCDLLGVI